MTNFRSLEVKSNPTKFMKSQSSSTFSTFTLIKHKVYEVYMSLQFVTRIVRLFFILSDNVTFFIPTRYCYGETQIIQLPMRLSKTVSLFLGVMVARYHIRSEHFDERENKNNREAYYQFQNKSYFTTSILCFSYLILTEKKLSIENGQGIR